MTPATLKSMGTAATSLFWIQWILANALGFGWGWWLARPTALDVARETNDALGALAFLVVFLAVPGGLQSILLLERLLLPERANGPIAVALGSFLLGALITVGSLMLIEFYFPYLTLAALVVGFGLAVVVLARAYHRTTREARWRVNWGLVWPRGRWVLGLTLGLVVLAATGQPWVRGDKGRSSGHVPVAVLGAMVGSLTGLAAVRLRKTVPSENAV